jgi:integrase
MIGARPLRALTAGDVRSALGQLVTRYSTRSLQITRNSLERAIRHAEANDLVGRNVAALVKPPRGRSGRPSKSFTLEQAKALLAAAERTRWHAYVALSLLVGIRTEEARALRWDHVVTWVDDADGWQPVTTAGFDAARQGDDRFAIYVWRSERYGGDTKTEKSRRTLALPQRCVEALRQHRKLQARDQLRAGEIWLDHGLVFASTVGTPLTANNVIRAFRALTKKAGLGQDWVPREMRHTFGWTEFVNSSWHEARLQLERDVGRPATEGVVIAGMSMQVRQQDCPVTVGRRAHVVEGTSSAEPSPGSRQLRRVRPGRVRPGRPWPSCRSARGAPRPPRAGCSRIGESRPPWAAGNPTGRRRGPDWCG